MMKFAATALVIAGVESLQVEKEFNEVNLYQRYAQLREKCGSNGDWEYERCSSLYWSKAVPNDSKLAAPEEGEGWWYCNLKWATPLFWVTRDDIASW